MSEKFIGAGLVASFSNDSFNLDDHTIDCVQSFTLPDEESEDVEVPCLEATILEKIPVPQTDIGEISLEIAWDWNDTVHQELSTRSRTKEVQEWRIDLPATKGNTDPTRLAFTGHIRAITGSSVGVSDLQTRTVVITRQSDFTITSPPA